MARPKKAAATPKASPAAAKQSELFTDTSKVVIDEASAPAQPLNPWRPVSDPTDLKALGKLAEELGELSSAVARCIIQGVDESDPVTFKANRRWLEEEIADVLACIEGVNLRFSPDENGINQRSAVKLKRLEQWLGMGAVGPTTVCNDCGADAHEVHAAGCISRADEGLPANSAGPAELDFS